MGIWDHYHKNVLGVRCPSRCIYWFASLSDVLSITKMRSLYICYQSILDPLTRTQVIAYLEGLASDGQSIYLLTFEPKAIPSEEEKRWQIKLESLGIQWFHKRYHKWPSVPATLFDISVGVRFARTLVRRHRKDLIHARGHVPGIIGLGLKRLLGVKLLFDIRGLMAEEYVDAGVWRQNGLKFKATKRAEKSLMREADGFVVLTHAANELLSAVYGKSFTAKPHAVIPCCVDLRKFENIRPTSRENTNTLVYVGKLGGWYLTDEMVRFAAAMIRQNPRCRWRVLTQSDAYELDAKLDEHGIRELVDVGSTSADQMPRELAKCNVGLSFVKPCLSKIVSSPTKNAEYLAAGLPVVSTRGIGDGDRLFGENSDVGTMVRDFTRESFVSAIERTQELLDDSNTPERCRTAAREHFDLHTVGWRKYRQLYKQLT